MNTPEDLSHLPALADILNVLGEEEGDLLVRTLRVAQAFRDSGVEPEGTVVEAVAVGFIIENNLDEEFLAYIKF